MDKKLAPEEKNKNLLLRNIFIGLLLVIIAFIIFLFPDIFHKQELISAEFSAVDKMCELATLKCYYHNVAEEEKQPDGLFKYGLFQYGYKKFWLEYNGIVKVGVDVNEVIINKPSEDGVVRIYVPKAKILAVDVEEESMSDLIANTGALTSITTDDQAKAYQLAQANMKECAESDTSILNAAHRNAKEVLKQYVINVGKQIGQDYTVEWIENLQTDSK